MRRRGAMEVDMSRWPGRKWLIRVLIALALFALILFALVRLAERFPWSGLE